MGISEMIVVLLVIYQRTSADKNDVKGIPGLIFMRLIQNFNDVHH